MQPVGHLTGILLYEFEVLGVCVVVGALLEHCDPTGSLDYAVLNLALGLIFRLLYY